MDRSTPIPAFSTHPARPGLSPEFRMQRDTRAGSWLNIASDSEAEQDDDASVHLSYLRASPSSVDDHELANSMTLPPSPHIKSQPRSRIPPSIAAASDDLWVPPPDHLPSGLSVFSSPTSSHLRSPPLSSSASDPDSPSHHFLERPHTIADSQHSSGFLRKVPLQPLSSMSLSTASSSSTRSSAYGSSTTGPPSDLGHSQLKEDHHVRVVSGDDDREHHADGGLSDHVITSDQVAQLLSFSTTSATRNSNAVDPRWSYTSTSSSMGRSNSIASHEKSSAESHDSSQLDNSWVVEEEGEDEEEEEYPGISESEAEATDDDEGFQFDAHLMGARHEEELTTAVLVAEEGTGQIVQADGIPVNKLNVLPGTTHLLLSSSPTPSLLPPFLLNLLPSICNTLLVLDISANFLLSLPPALTLCKSLEELNIASNPLRVLPVFLCELTALRVLIADATGLTSTAPSGTSPNMQGQASSFTGIPDSLVELERLHTLSIRRNKLYSLPAWLCKLPSLTTLCVDGNPFQGPWKALVEPLLAKVPTAPAYPPSTPTYPTAAAGEPSPAPSDEAGTLTDVDDQEFIDDLPTSASVSASVSRSSSVGPVDTPTEEEQEYTIKAPMLGRAVTSPIPGPTPPLPTKAPLQRTRTAPNRNFISGSRSPAGYSDVKDKPLPSPNSQEKEVRRMKSAGDLRRGQSSTALAESARQQQGAIPESISAAARNFGHAASMTSLLNMDSVPPPEAPERMARRFASVGAGSVLGGSASPSRNNGRGNVQSLWDNGSARQTEPYDDVHRVSFAASTQRPGSGHSRQPSEVKGRGRSGSKGEKEKTRWGFLKKMSMGKLNGKDPSSPPNSRIGTPQKSSPSPRARHQTTSSISPQIDMRFSMNGLSMPSLSISPPPPHPELAKQPSLDALTTLRQAPTPPAANSLVPPSPVNTLSPGNPPSLRPKRRSFLPINMLSVPDSAAFMGDVVVDRDRTPSPIPMTTSPIEGPLLTDKELADEIALREEERMREAYARALRSVMAYLRDMFDLGVSQQPEEMGVRSRRPTMIDRDGSTLSSSSRNGTATLSVATTDSTGSGEEKKCKDDKAKRAMIVREILETERTYVKGLDELVDIYIKPASGPVNILSGVSKETIVPAAERKVVFSGLESLFSFHKESFLPALENAAKPIMIPSDQLREADADGLLSLKVAKAVGNIFVKHAAFMRMYSTYINNCDNAAQRVKYWTSDRQPTPSPIPSSATSPASSTAQLVGFGLAMSAVSTPAAVVESNVATGLPNLSPSQKKRIKSYLKRCRLNPRHSQISLEAYLLLPVQRIPRYRMLLEELSRSSPPTYEYMDDPLDRAVAEISSLAMNMNEGKRESESRHKLVQWQSRIRAKFHSPLVQPHRRLIMDGPLLLTRVVRKAMVAFETINAQGDATTVQVDCLAPELTPRPLVGILCNDLLVLCREANDGGAAEGAVDLWAVLRMQTLPQPASIVHGNSLRLVDSKAVLYFDAPSASDALTWFRAINLHIPASQS